MTSAHGREPTADVDADATDVESVSPLADRLRRLHWPAPEPGLKARMLRDFEERVGIKGELEDDLGDEPAA
jgi:hypothetical protein